MRDTSNVKRYVRIIDQEGNLLYDNRPEWVGVDYVELRGLNAGIFVAYLLVNWPNHWAIKALNEDRKRGTLKAETLQDLIQEIELTEEDAKKLKAVMEGRETL